MARPREACGVFGVFAPGSDVAQMAFLALHALQHRGQESAGIAASDLDTASVQRGMGRVAQVFDEESLRSLRGALAIGHTRYSTAGGSDLHNAQPFLIETACGPLAVAHNGNLTNAPALRRGVLERGLDLLASSDSALIAQLLAASTTNGGSAAPWETHIAALMGQMEGAYSLVVLTRDALFGVRDPLGLRPLCLGELPGATGQNHSAIASESCALASIGARFLREVRPGEIVRIDGAGLRSIQGQPSPRRALCVFEYVYFARPDSILEGQTVHGVRQLLGAALWREAPVSADVVVGVPDTALPAAIGFSCASGIPFSAGLTANCYVGRTFIQPDDRSRRAGVSSKYQRAPRDLRGQRVVLIDDSIVRGNTAGPLVRLLRDAGAAEVHLRVSAPPVRFPCFMGVDMAVPDELIAHQSTVAEIQERVDADSLAYLSQDGMMAAVRGETRGEARHCSACFDGRYPLAVADRLEARAGAPVLEAGAEGRYRGSLSP
ncbi:MAG: amidophosphoribosyltransferase [Deltaproteobacteria bacterium]|nr:amidophosphoribosyltransferase [Deltaproteobacteria bacterium]